METANSVRPSLTSFQKLLIAAGIVGVIIVALLMDIFGFRSTCVGIEESTRAQSVQARLAHSNMTAQVNEIAQVPEMYRDDLIQVVNAEMNGRYGTGTPRVTQFMVEHNITLDASVYRRLQDVIEARRNSFNEEQRSLNDHAREYRTYLTQNFRHQLYNETFFHFPHIDLDRVTQVILTAETQRAYETGVDAPTRLRR